MNDVTPLTSAYAQDEALDKTPDGALDAPSLAAIMDQRASTYAYLARLFRAEVDADLLSAMHDDLYPVSSGNDSVDAGNRLIATYLSNLHPGSLEELHVDYARCFIGSGTDASTAAYPFESVYTSPKRLLMQDARDEVRAVYRAAGLERQDNWNEGEDHLSLEFEYEAMLCRRCATALRSGHEDEAASLAASQRNFFSDHIATWVPLMLADLRRFAASELYQGVADLTEGFLAIEAELLEELAA